MNTPKPISVRFATDHATRHGWHLSSAHGTNPIYGLPAWVIEDIMRFGSEDWEPNNGAGSVTRETIRDAIRGIRRPSVRIVENDVLVLPSPTDVQTIG